MKRILCLLCFCFIILTACGKKELTTLEQIKSRNSLTVGVSQDAGAFGHLNKNGELEGFDIDVAKYIAKKLIGSDKMIKFEVLTPNNRIEAIMSGNVDIVVSTMSITESRKMLIDFSMPYYTAGQTAVVKNDSNIHTFADLRNKKTIVVLGTTAERNIRRIMPAAKLIGFPDYDEAFLAFEAGEAITYGLFNAQERGILFISPGEKVYGGMVVGQTGKAEDIEINVCKKKQLTNTRSSSADEALRLTPPKILSLEQALEFIDVDELLEITPKSLRIRKRILDPTMRKRANFNRG